MVDKKTFETNIEGEYTTLKTMYNSRGTEIGVTNFGARVVYWKFKGVNIVVGFDTLEGYLRATDFYYGATIGRYANRINKGQFTLHSREYVLAINNPPNHLHGGPGGFHNCIWQFESFTSNEIQLSYISNDGEEGYPGELKVTLTYRLTDDDQLEISYKATTAADTIINLTNHSYFNLNGAASGSIINHQLQINSDQITPIDETLIPTGSFLNVEGSAFDFTTKKPIGKDIEKAEQQLIFGKGYDHNYVLNKMNDKYALAATAEGDITGITLKVYTDQPGMQFYSGNFMTGQNKIIGGTDDFRTAFCLETQHYPDSPNQPAFPSTLLQKEKVFQSKTVYAVSSST